MSLGRSSSGCTAMCRSCGTAVATSRVVPRGSPRGLGWPAPTCITNPFGPELCLLPPLGALAVCRYQPHRCWLVGLWAQGLGPRDVHIGSLVFAVHQHVTEDVHEGRWRVIRRPLRPGGQVVLAAVAPYVEVQAVRGHPRASVGVLFGPRDNIAWRGLQLDVAALGHMMVL